MLERGAQLQDVQDRAIYLVPRRTGVIPREPGKVCGPGPIPFLRHVPLFASLDIGQLTIVSAFVVTRQVARGELVTLEGQPAGGLYIVASGSFKRFKTSRGGREQILHLLLSGDSFGEVSLLDGGDDFASTQALERGVLYALPRYWFGPLLDEVPALVRGLNRSLAARVRHISDVVEDLSFHHVLERVAKLVVEQSLDPSRPRLTQADMAGITGTTREVVARTLHELEQGGAITVQRGRISVRDPDILRRIAAGGDDTTATLDIQAKPVRRRRA